MKKNEIDGDIKRFCQVISQITKLNKKLDKAYDNFYSGGYTFEEAYSSEIDDISNLQEEFLELFNRIHKK